MSTHLLYTSYIVQNAGILSIWPNCLMALDAGGPESYVGKVLEERVEGDLDGGPGTDTCHSGETHTNCET